MQIRPFRETPVEWAHVCAISRRLAGRRKERAAAAACFLSGGAGVFVVVATVGRLSLRFAIISPLVRFFQIDVKMILLKYLFEVNLIFCDDSRGA